MMLYQIVSFLLDVATGLVGGACLLRLYMQHEYVGFSNPVGRFVMALTDWLVLPLRRVVPSVQRWDSASLLAAFVLELGQFLLLWLLAGALSPISAVPVLAFFGVVRLVLSGLTALVMAYAIMSWMGNRNPMTEVIERLVTPILQPIRRHVPLVGGMDLSPLVLLVILQVLIMLVASLQNDVLKAI